MVAGLTCFENRIILRRVLLTVLVITVSNAVISTVLVNSIAYGSAFTYSSIVLSGLTLCFLEVGTLKSNIKFLSISFYTALAWFIMEILFVIIGPQGNETFFLNQF